MAIMIPSDIEEFETEGETYSISKFKIQIAN